MASTPLKVVVLGDSLVWGQGLREEDKFSNKALGRIAALQGRRLHVERNLSRSGAQVLDGRTSAERKRKRAAYVAENPTRFNTRKLRDDFIERDDQLVTLLLAQEVPSTYPTVTFQAGMISGPTGQEIEVVLLNGGLNDLDFQTYLDPENGAGDFIAAFDDALRDIFYRRVSQLLRKVRLKFPNALLIYTGYFSPFAFGVDNRRLQDFIEDEQNVNAVDLFLNGIARVHDIPRVVSEVQLRAEHGLGRGLYWLRRAVAEAALAPAPGVPGILFVHPRFTGENTVFARKSFLHAVYRPDRVRDKAAAQRLSQIPRAGSEAKMRSLLHQCQFGTPSTEALRGLLHEVDGSESLLSALRKFQSNLGSIAARTATTQALTAELKRITNARRASFLHPNEHGADRYTETIVERYAQQHRAVRLREGIIRLAGALHATPGTGAIALMARYGFPRLRSARQIIQFSCIDSIAVTIDMAAQSIGPTSMFDDVFIELGPDLRFRLNLPYLSKPVLDSLGLDTGKVRGLSKLVSQFVPGTSEQFTLDAQGIHLSRISELTLLRRKSDALGRSISKPSFHADALMLTFIKLELNGVEVFSSVITEPLTRTRALRLPYPLR